MCDISSPAELELLLQDSYHECGTHGIHIYMMQMVQETNRFSYAHVQVAA